MAHAATLIDEHALIDEAVRIRRVFTRRIWIGLAAYVALSVAISACRGDDAPQSVGLRPATAPAAPATAPFLPVDPLALATGAVAEARAQLAAREAELARAQAAAVAAAREARLAPVRASLGWAAGVGALLGLLSTAAWVAALWCSFPVGRGLLGAAAVAGWGLCALALVAGESLPIVVRAGPWAALACAIAAAGWIAWKLVLAGRANAAYGDDAECEDPADQRRLDALKLAHAERQQRRGVHALAGWLRGRAPAEVRAGYQRLITRTSDRAAAERDTELLPHRVHA